ncbi:MAG: hypothetical protein GWN94_18685 [Phycisphaerae bacterium]|nr:hypothetical protein [Phycisphaerae bacterium]
MGRELRMVPPDWEHPKDEKGHHIPLFCGYSDRLAEWDKYRKTHSEEEAIEWMGHRPEPEWYMPEWTPEEATHYMMYEDTSEGTPISPAFATPEELARWLADTGASAFADQGASYEAWLNTIQRGYAFSAAFSLSTGMISGVEAGYLMEKDDEQTEL